jgi:hypothetical protein
MIKKAIFIVLVLVPQLVFSDVAVIKNVTLQSYNNRWTFNVTLQHADTGWDHYADGWRIIDAKGTELGYRTLHHPHVNEQPFTRSLSSVIIPAGTKVIFVEAHDKIHGWNKDKVRIDLSKPKAKRYQIK